MNKILAACMVGIMMVACMPGMVILGVDTDYPVVLTVKDNEGKIVEYAKVIISAGQEEKEAIYTNSAGQARLRLVAGDYKYKISCNGYENAAGDFSVASSAEIAVVQKAQGFAYTFGVKDENGKGIAGASITIKDIEGKGIIKIITTGGGGSVITRMDNNRYQYEIGKSYYSSETGVMAVPLENSANAVLKTTHYPVTFKVSDQRGAPVVGAEITIKPSDSTQVYTTVAGGSVTVYLQSGVYTYAVQKQDYDAGSGSITMAKAAISREITITSLLAPKYKVSFTVKDSSEKVQSGAEIKVFKGEGNEVATINTSSAGTATENLEDGEYQYAVTKQYFSTAKGSFTVKENAVNLSAVIDQIAQPKYKINFTLKDENDKGIASAQISVKSSDQSLVAEGTTSSAGTAIVEAEAGKYTFFIAKDGYKTATHSITLTGTGLNIIVYMVQSADATAPAYKGASSWAIPELDKAATLGLLTEEVRGDVSKPITRGEFAAISVAMYEKATKKVAPLPEKNPFTDTKDIRILKASQIGIVKGITDTTFEPSSLISREQIAVMLTRLAKAIAPEKVDGSEEKITFLDKEKISDWAKIEVAFMAKNGLMKGTNNEFGPNDTTTREMAVVIAVRLHAFMVGVAQ